MSNYIPVKKKIDTHCICSIKKFVNIIYIKIVFFWITPDAVKQDYDMELRKQTKKLVRMLWLWFTNEVTRLNQSSIQGVRGSLKCLKSEIL